MDKLFDNVFRFLFAVGLFLWVGKELDLLPFIYGPATCAQAKTKP